RADGIAAVSLRSSASGGLSTTARGVTGSAVTGGQVMSEYTMPAMSRRPDRLARYHALSGILIAFFASLHLLNHAAALGGPVAFSYLRALLHHVYQFPAYEILGLSLPILFNMFTGVVMLARPIEATGRADGAPIGLRRRLHRWSGLFLILLVLPHA